MGNFDDFDAVPGNPLGNRERGALVILFCLFVWMVAQITKKSFGQRRSVFYEDEEDEEEKEVQFWVNWHVVLDVANHGALTNTMCVEGIPPPGVWLGEKRGANMMSESEGNNAKFVCYRRQAAEVLGENAVVVGAPVGAAKIETFMRDNDFGSQRRGSEGVSNFVEVAPPGPK